MFVQLSHKILLRQVKLAMAQATPAATPTAPEAVSPPPSPTPVHITTVAARDPSPAPAAVAPAVAVAPAAVGQTTPAGPNTAAAAPAPPPAPPAVAAVQAPSSSITHITLHPFLVRALEKISAECIRKEQSKLKDLCKETADFVGKLVSAVKEAPPEAAYALDVFSCLRTYLIGFSDKPADVAISEADFQRLANKVLKTLKEAVASKNPKIIGLGLDCIQVRLALLLSAYALAHCCRYAVEIHGI
jgi:hypothetical protein